MTALHVSDTAHEELAAWLRRFDEEPARAREATVHLIVTPLGLADARRLLTDLGALGLTVLQRSSLTCWSRLSTVLQVTKRTVAALERAVVFERLWQRVAPDDRAEAWSLSRADALALLPHKRRLRVGYVNLGVDLGAALPNGRATLHAFHLADAHDLDDAAARLETATWLLSRPAD
jgi:hypothetical protein